MPKSWSRPAGARSVSSSSAHSSRSSSLSRSAISVETVGDTAILADSDGLDRHDRPGPLPGRRQLLPAEPTDHWAKRCRPSRVPGPLPTASCTASRLDRCAYSACSIGQARRCWDRPLHKRRSCQQIHIGLLDDRALGHRARAMHYIVRRYAYDTISLANGAFKPIRTARRLVSAALLNRTTVFAATTSCTAR